MKTFLIRGHLTKYNVPLKPPKGMIKVVDKDDKPIDERRVICSEPMLAVDWTRFLHTEFNLYWSKERPEPLADEAPIDVIRKWFNTREFHKKVCKLCNRNKEN